MHISEYLPLTGLRSFTRLSAHLVLEDESGTSSALTAERVHSVQCLGGTGALRLAVEFLKRANPLLLASTGDSTASAPSPTVFVPASTWPTHLNLLRHAGVPFKTYRYLTPNGLALDFPGLLQVGSCV